MLSAPISDCIVGVIGPTRNFAIPSDTRICLLTDVEGLAVCELCDTFLLVAEIKTKPTPFSVEEFIASIDPAGKREDAKVLDSLFRKVTGEVPQIWGTSIIGYGSYHYRYDSGHEGDMCRIGFSPRKAKHSLYLLSGCSDEVTSRKNEELLGSLGKHSQGKGCLYINKLADVDMDMLEELVRVNWDAMKRAYPPE